jgi:uncharacterized protein (DUF58 family)
MQAITPLLSPDLLAKLERLELVSRKIFRGRLKGERRSPRKGQSVEFVDFRPYVRGDDLRLLDWNLYARLDKLFLKLFQEEEDLHFYALVDTSGSMGFGSPTKLDWTKQLAAALSFVALAGADRVKIETLAQPLHHRSPALRGRRSIWRMLDEVNSLEPSDQVSFAQGIKNFCLRNPGRGIVVVISDLLDKSGYESGLRYLSARQMDAYVVQPLSPEELDPDLRGDLRLVDCEDGEVTEVSASPALLASYRRTLTTFLDGVQRFCARRNIAHVMARTDQPVEQLVLKYLRRRGLVR